MLCTYNSRERDDDVVDYAAFTLTAHGQENDGSRKENKSLPLAYVSPQCTMNIIRMGMEKKRHPLDGLKGGSGTLHLYIFIISSIYYFILFSHFLSKYLIYKAVSIFFLGLITNGLSAIYF